MKMLFAFFLMFLSSSLLAENDWQPDISDPNVIAHNSAIDVYRSPNCHCCHRWIEHLEQHGFDVIDHLSQNMSEVKEKVGLPKPMASCHTAIIDGYIVEGHVPAKDILSMLANKPDIKGLSVPQMPVGTPGMEMGERKDNFDVISFDNQGEYHIYQRYQLDSENRYQAVND